MFLLRGRTKYSTFQEARHTKQRYKNTVLIFFSFFIMLSVWELLSLIFPPAFIPSPIRVGEVMVQNFYIPRGPGLHTALYHIGRSMERIAIGFLLSMLVGGMIGIAIGINRHADTMLSQWVAVGLTIPSLFWALIAVMWFRISETTAIFTILAVSFPYVSVQMAAAVKNANKNLVDMARVFGSSRSLMIRKVFIPQLMPNIFSAGRSAFAMSWKVCTIAELFGLSDGVGFMLNYWFGEFRIEQVMAWILAFVLIMLAIENFVLVRLEKRVLRWRPEVVV